MSKFACANEECENLINDETVIFCEACGFGYCGHCIASSVNVPKLHCKPLEFCIYCNEVRIPHIKMLLEVLEIVKFSRLTDEKHLLAEWS